MAAAGGRPEVGRAISEILVVAFLGSLLVIFATGILVMVIAFVLDIFGLSIPPAVYGAIVVVALIVGLAWAIALWNRPDRRARVPGKRTGRSAS